MAAPSAVAAPGNVACQQATPADGPALPAPQSAHVARGLGGDAEDAAPRRLVPVVVLSQFLFWFGVALFIPVYPYIWSNTETAGGDEGRGASLHALGTTLNAVAEFLSASLLGVLSDRYGRRPFLMLSSIGQVVDYSLAALAARGGLGSPAAYFMLGGRCFAGLSGNFEIFSKASMGDASTLQTSTRNFTALFACTGAALIVGVPVGGILADAYGLHLPMLIAAAANTANLLIIGFVLPEPLRQENREQRHWRSANPFGAMGFLLTSRFLIVFGLMSTLDSFCLNILKVFIVSFASIQFDVGPAVVGTLPIVFAISQIVAFALVLQPMVRCCGEVRVIKLGYAITCVSYIVYPLASYTNVFALMSVATLLQGVGTISIPTQNAVASRCVAPTQQGMLQAAIGSLDVIGKVLSAGLISLTFEPLLRAGQPEGVWWAALGIMLPGVAVAFYIRRFLPASFTESNTWSRRGKELEDEDVEKKCDGVEKEVPEAL